jgi:hypothetical protein
MQRMRDLAEGFSDRPVSSMDLPDQPSKQKQLPTTSASTAVDWFREALPVELRVQTGALVLGSDATPMVLIADFKRADGILTVSEVSCASTTE